MVFLQALMLDGLCYYEYNTQQLFVLINRYILFYIETIHQTWLLMMALYL